MPPNCAWLLCTGGPKKKDTQNNTKLCRADPNKGTHKNATKLCVAALHGWTKKKDTKCHKIVLPSIHETDSSLRPTLQAGQKRVHNNQFTTSKHRQCDEAEHAFIHNFQVSLTLGQFTTVPSHTVCTLALDRLSLSSLSRHTYA